jgi:dUTP pyrophosphatase
MSVKIVCNEGVTPPVYATEGSAGFDFVANNFKFVYTGNKKVDAKDFINAYGQLVLEPGQRALIGTGVFVALPQGLELQVRPRSGLALKEGITVLNSPGTIDADYRGEIGVILINHSEDNAYIKLGDRIAQGVVAPYVKIEWSQVDTLDETARGEGGFGHSGKN